MSSEFKERLSLFLSTGGKKATLLWLINRVFGLELYGFYEYSLDKGKQSSKPSCKSLLLNLQFIAVSNMSELEKLPNSLVVEFNKQSGGSIAGLLNKGGYFFALVEEMKPVAQLNIYRNFPVTVDTPLK